MLRIKQIGTICFAISILISAPLFATDIPSSASTADCKYTPLQVYSGQSNLEAGWQANTIQLHWYDGDDEIQNVPSASQSCVYDGTLTPPATIPTKTGYTFKGWRVRQAPVISLSSLNTSINGTWYAMKTAGGCLYASSTSLSENCAESYFTGLSNGEWAVGFSYGTIKGTATCTGSSRVEPNSYAFETGENVSVYAGCECAITGFTPSGGSFQNMSNPSAWNYEDEILLNSCGGCAEDDGWCLDEAQACVEDISSCAGNCPSYCAQEVETNSYARTRLYGQSNY